MSRPRLPSFHGLAKRSFWLFFGGIWLLTGLVMFVVAAGTALQERTWAAEAVQTTGMVVTKDIIPADSDSSTEYRVRFRFTTQDGSAVEGNQEVEVETWEGLTERGPVEVHYLPSSPSSARLEPGAERPAGERRLPNRGGVIVDRLLDHHAEQLCLAREMRIQRRRRYAGVAGDLFHAGFGEALPGEDVLGGDEDVTALPLCSCGPQYRRHAPSEKQRSPLSL